MSSKQMPPAASVKDPNDLIGSITPTTKRQDNIPGYPTSINIPTTPVNSDVFRPGMGGYIRRRTRRNVSKSKRKCNKCKRIKNKSNRRKQV
jgi:hypothetical protein